MSNARTHRCGVCNRTNNADVITYPEEYFGGGYRKDPFYPHLEVCSECDDAIYDATLDWDDEEDEDDLFDEEEDDFAEEPS